MLNNKNIKKLLIASIFLSVIIIIVLTILIFSQRKPVKQERKDAVSSSKEISSFPTGSVYFSAIKREGNNYGIYILNLTGKKIAKYLVNKDWSYLDSKLSHKLDKVLFVGEKNGESQLYIADVNDNKNIKQLAIDNKDLTIKRMPSWSRDDTMIVYQDIPAESDLDQRYWAKNWKIHLFYLSSGIDRVITNGINPIFLDNGKLIITKDDGIYLLDPNIEDGYQQLILFFNNPTNLNTKTILSQDQTMIAISDRDNINIFKINNWSDLDMLNNPHIIHKQAHGIIFSPDNKFMLLQTLKSKTQKSKLTVIELQKEQQVKNDIFNLDEFKDEDDLFITDWIK